MRPTDKQVRVATISWWATNAAQPPVLDELRARIEALWTLNRGVVRVGVRPVRYLDGALRLVIELEDADGMLLVYWAPLDGMRKHGLEEVVIGRDGSLAMPGGIEPHVR